MKQAGGETLYLKVDRNVQVHDKKITIGDLAQILCTDKQTENLVKTIKVPQATNGKPGRHTMSVMELIERIQEEVSGLEINNIGEYDFLVTYEAEKQPGRVLSYAKTIFVAALSFFGAAFTIIKQDQAKKKELENQLAEVEKRAKQNTLLREKTKAEESFEQEKGVLDKALVMEIISKEEYEQKLNIAKKKVENFEEIKKIEQQFEMGIITKEEKDEKINAILNA